MGVDKCSGDHCRMGEMPGTGFGFNVRALIESKWRLLSSRVFDTLFRSAPHLILRYFFATRHERVGSVASGISLNSLHLQIYCIFLTSLVKRFVTN